MAGEKRVGLIGFFGAGAFCDDLIGHVTAELLREMSPYKLHVDFTTVGRSRSSPLLSDLVALLNSYDLLVHCGGSLLGKCTYPPINNIDLWAGKVSTPLAIFGGAYRYEPELEPLPPDMRNRLNILFQRAAVISLRGGYTWRSLVRNGVELGDGVTFGDPVMAVSERADQVPAFVVGNVRCPPENEVVFVSQDEVYPRMAEIYDWLVERHGVPLNLVSFRSNMAIDNDIVGAKRTIACMKHRKDAQIVEPAGYMEAFRYLRYAVFHFGQRLHPSVFAAVWGIPFVGLDYQFFKMQDWADTLNIYNWLSTEDLTLEAFIKTHDAVDGEMQTVKEQLPARIDLIRGVAKKIVGLLSTSPG